MAAIKRLKVSEHTVHRRPLNSPDLNPIDLLWDVLDKQVQSMDAPPRNLKDLNDLLPTSRCQISKHTIRSLVESMSWWVQPQWSMTSCVPGIHTNKRQRAQLTYMASVLGAHAYSLSLAMWSTKTPFQLVDADDHCGTDTHSNDLLFLIATEDKLLEWRGAGVSTSTE